MGLARSFGSSEEDPNLTCEYVVCRWYRAPEVILFASESGKSIDVWSVGCILCELVGRKPLFPGKDHLDQIKKIIQVTGTPTEADIDWLPARSPTRSFIEKVPLCQKQAWSSVYPKATPAGIEAMEQMLTFHPRRRATAQDAIALPYYDSLHMPDDEPTAEIPYTWQVGELPLDKRLLQNHVYAECANFYPDLFVRDAALLGERGNIPAPTSNLPHCRHKIPLQLASQQASDSVTIVCTNLAGEVVGQFEDLAWHQTLSALVALVQEHVAPPCGARWQLVLPNATCPDEGQFSATLYELFTGQASS